MFNIKAANLKVYLFFHFSVPLTSNPTILYAYYSCAYYKEEVITSLPIKTKRILGLEPVQIQVQITMVYA